MLEGAAIARQFSRLLAEAREIDSSSLGGGITAEYLAGIAGIALGILSLANISPLILAPIAAIIFGGALIMGSGITSRLNTMAIHQKEENAMIRQVSREAISAAANIRVLIGIGAATLGILSLVGLSPILLTIIAVLGIGFSDLLSGTAITGRMISLFSGQ